MTPRHEAAIRILKDALREPGIGIDRDLGIREAISVLGNPGPAKIKKAEYSKYVDPKTDYSTLYLTFEDGTEKQFHYHKNNPMPAASNVIGSTWDELVSMATGMFYLAAGDFHMQEPVSPFLKPDSIHVTLPVPIGGTAWQYSLDCGGQCENKETSIQYNQGGPDLGCFQGSKCHTRFHSVEPFTVGLGNIGTILEQFGKTVFATEAEAYKAAEEKIRENQEYWKKGGTL